MITKYWRTIIHTNICSNLQDHRIYASSIEHVLKHQKHKRSSKDYSRRSEEMSSRSQHHGSEEKDVSPKLNRSSDSVEIIILRRPSQTQKTPLNLEDLQTSELIDGPRLHVRFVVFYGCPHQRIWAQFCLPLTTCKNRQRTSSAIRMNEYFLFQKRIFEWLSNKIIHIRQWLNILDLKLLNDS